MQPENKCKLRLFNMIDNTNKNNDSERLQQIKLKQDSEKRTDQIIASKEENKMKAGHKHSIARWRITLQRLQRSSSARSP
jgi:hypothetical protein